jgi:hypothetical protein
MAARDPGHIRQVVDTAAVKTPPMSDLREWVGPLGVSLRDARDVF